jgi:hypothetical protein
MSLNPFSGNHYTNVAYTSTVLNHDPKLLHLILNQKIDTIAEGNSKNRNDTVESVARKIVVNLTCLHVAFS